MAKKKPLKSDWQAYLKVVERYAKDLKKWVSKLKPGEVTTKVSGPGSNPPPPPPPPPPR